MLTGGVYQPFVYLQEIIFHTQVRPPNFSLSPPNNINAHRPRLESSKANHVTSRSPQQSPYDERGGHSACVRFIRQFANVQILHHVTDEEGQLLIGRLLVPLVQQEVIQGLAQPRQNLDKTRTVSVLFDDVEQPVGEGFPSRGRLKHKITTSDTLF